MTCQSKSYWARRRYQCGLCDKSVLEGEWIGYEYCKGSEGHKILRCRECDKCVRKAIRTSRNKEVITFIAKSHRTPDYYLKTKDEFILCILGMKEMGFEYDYAGRCECSS